VRCFLGGIPLCQLLRPLRLHFRLHILHEILRWLLQDAKHLSKILTGDVRGAAHEHSRPNKVHETHGSAGWTLCEFWWSVSSQAWGPLKLGDHYGMIRETNKRNRLPSLGGVDTDDTKHGKQRPNGREVDAGTRKRVWGVKNLFLVRIIRGNNKKIHNSSHYSWWLRVS
jgi:hypothetical protein